MPLLTINGNTYDYPDPGTEPGWGESASAWAEAVTEVLNTLISPGDILETSATIQDNIPTPMNVDRLVFDGLQVRAANISYTVNRNGASQSATIQLTYNTSAPVNEKWHMIETNKNGDVGVIFSVLDSGQVQYRSTSTGSAGEIKFTAKALAQ